MRAPILPQIMCTTAIELCGLFYACSYPFLRNIHAKSQDAWKLVHIIWSRNILTNTMQFHPIFSNLHWEYSLFWDLGFLPFLRGFKKVCSSQYITGVTAEMISTREGVTDPRRSEIQNCIRKKRGRKKPLRKSCLPVINGIVRQLHQSHCKILTLQKDLSAEGKRTHWIIKCTLAFSSRLKIN